MFARHYAKYYSVLNSEKKYKDEIEFVYDWAGKPKEVLDIGCGTANYWKYFPGHVRIRGVERSEEMREASGLGEEVLNIDIQNDRIKGVNRYGLITALFDVMNYIPVHNWWKRLPFRKNGTFIFDVWDKEKVDRDGFRRTDRIVGDVRRVIFPISYDGREVRLRVMLFGPGFVHTEVHKMFLFSKKDIERFAGKCFEIEEVKKTEKWQSWYRLRRK